MGAFPAQSVERKIEGLKCKRKRKGKSFLSGECLPVSQCAAASYLPVYLPVCSWCTARCGHLQIACFAAYAYPHSPDSLTCLRTWLQLPACSSRNWSTTAAVEYQFRLFLQLLWPCFAFVNLDFHGGCVFWDSRLQRLSFFPSCEEFAKCSVVPGKWVCGRLVPVLKRCTCLFFALWAFRCRLLTNVFAGVGWDGRSACIQNQRLYTKPAVVYKTSGYISIPYHIISIYAYHIISWLHYFPLKPVCVVSPAKKIGWWWRFCFCFILIPLLR